MSKEIKLDSSGKPIYDPPKKGFLQFQSSYDKELSEYKDAYQKILDRWKHGQDLSIEYAAQQAEIAEQEANAAATASNAKTEEAKAKTTLNKSRPTKTKTKTTTVAENVTSLDPYPIGGALAGGLAGFTYFGPIGGIIGAGVGFVVGRTLES